MPQAEATKVYSALCDSMRGASASVVFDIEREQHDFIEGPAFGPVTRRTARVVKP
jgi:hypothetical protein